MSFVFATPDEPSVSAANLQSIGAAPNAQNTASASPAVAVVPAAADEVRC